ncbi:MAG TPA: adenosylcobinamide-GDP ribazoletransferase [Jatrophihabitans sp.]|jgi:adenosylcobinamide-GDP ribazoletransferase
MTARFAGLRLGLTTLTVLPLPPGVIDRRTAGRAMASAPAIGFGLGAVIAGIGWCLLKLGLPSLAAGVLLVVTLALLTRGLHLDGLADTVDGLGAYRDRDRSLAIMSSPEVGPMGVAAICAVMLLDAAALSSLLDHRRWFAVAVAVGIGRLAITICCGRGVPAARSTGLGAIVAGTVPVQISLGWLVILGLLGGFAHRLWWVGPVALLLSVAAALVLLRHIVTRFGGITGDVLGAECEIATAIALLTLAVR